LTSALSSRLQRRQLEPPGALRKLRDVVHGLNAPISSVKSLAPIIGWSAGMTMTASNGPLWAATIIFAGGTTNMIAGGEESKAA
jgi:hypothetical protein